VHKQKLLVLKVLLINRIFFLASSFISLNVRRIFGFEALETLQILTLRNRSALPITDTELKLIAAAAIIGLNSRPKAGYSTPARQFVVRL
jgi:hypothetical protein